MTEYVAGSLAVMLRLVLAHRTNVVSGVDFAHPPPHDRRHLREYLSMFQYPVYFNRGVSCIPVPVRNLQLKLPNGDVFMKNVLERHAEEIMREPNHSDSLVSNVLLQLHAILGNGSVSREAVATQVGMSDRSLHRKLNELGTSYRELLDQVRFEAADQRLREGSDSSSRIAQDLEFSTHQAFLRWFCQRTGMTPGDYWLKSSMPDTVVSKT